MRALFPILMLLWACGDKDEEDSARPLRWYSTCGDPACSGYSGPFKGVPLCSELPGGAPSEEQLCTEEGERCDPVDDCNALMSCAAEDPKDQEGGCPISRAAMKRDIQYLSPGELGALERDLMAMKLAKWSYKEDDPDAKPRLGFLIDDAPGSPAVRPDGERVDLYGYTSLAVAALQVQAAQIEALQAEVAALRAQVEEGVCPTP